MDAHMNTHTTPQGFMCKSENRTLMTAMTARRYTNAPRQYHHAQQQSPSAAQVPAGLTSSELETAVLPELSPRLRQPTTHERGLSEVP